MNAMKAIILPICNKYYKQFVKRFFVAIYTPFSQLGDCLSKPIQIEINGAKQSRIQNQIENEKTNRRAYTVANLILIYAIA